MYKFCNKNKEKIPSFYKSRTLGLDCWNHVIEIFAFKLFFLTYYILTVLQVGFWLSTLLNLIKLYKNVQTCNYSGKETFMHS